MNSNNKDFTLTYGHPWKTTHTTSHTHTVEGALRVLIRSRLATLNLIMLCPAAILDLIFTHIFALCLVLAGRLEYFSYFNLN